jgi:hypothetical protein
MWGVREVSWGHRRGWRLRRAAYGRQWQFHKTAAYETFAIWLKKDRQHGGLGFDRIDEASRRGVVRGSVLVRYARL